MNILQQIVIKLSKPRLLFHVKSRQSTKRYLSLKNCNDVPPKTMQDVYELLIEHVGAQRWYGSNTYDRKELQNLLPKSQEELPVRRMQDSYNSAIIPIGSSAKLQEKYVTARYGVRIGRLLEDLDIFAVWICYKHLYNPKQQHGKSPYSVVTGFVDKIHFTSQIVKSDADIRLSGHVTWVGTTSMEVTMKMDQYYNDTWLPLTEAVFVMVAHDCTNQCSAFVNAISMETEEETAIFNCGKTCSPSSLHYHRLTVWRSRWSATSTDAGTLSLTSSGDSVRGTRKFMTPMGESRRRVYIQTKWETEGTSERSSLRQGNRLRRLQMQDESLLKRPPSERERVLIHDHFLEAVDHKAKSFNVRIKPENSAWMEDAELKSLIICHPENRNKFNKISGGFVMHQALELALANASIFSKSHPYVLHVDDIWFRKPVEIGSLLHFHSQVVYTEGLLIQVRVFAEVIDPQTGKQDVTNIFHFTFSVKDPIPRVIPKSYDEAMMYLDGRRHFQEMQTLR